MGRIPRADTEARVRRWMADYKPHRIPAAFTDRTIETKGYFNHAR
jgi:hypothetical protein